MIDPKKTRAWQAVPPPTPAQEAAEMRGTWWAVHTGEPPNCRQHGKFRDRDAAEAEATKVPGARVEQVTIHYLHAAEAGALDWTPTALPEDVRKAWHDHRDRQARIEARVARGIRLVLYAGIYWALQPIAFWRFALVAFMIGMIAASSATDKSGT